MRYRRGVSRRLLSIPTLRRVAEKTVGPVAVARLRGTDIPDDRVGEGGGEGGEEGEGKRCVPREGA